MTREELIGYLGSMDHDANTKDFWPSIVTFVAAWIAREGGRFGMHEADTDAMVKAWREEMGANERALLVGHQH